MSLLPQQLPARSLKEEVNQVKEVNEVKEL